MSTSSANSAINTWRKGQFKRAKATADLLQTTHAAHRWSNTIWALTLRPILGAIVLGPFLLWMMALGIRKGFYAIKDRWQATDKAETRQREQNYWTGSNSSGRSRSLVWNEGWRCITAFMSLLFSLLQGVVIACAVDKMLANFSNVGGFLHEHFSDGVDVALEAAFGAVTAQVNYFLTWSFLKGVFTNGFFPAKKSDENTWLKWMGRALALVVAAVAATVMAILTLYALTGSAILTGMGFDAAFVDTIAWIGFGTTSLVYTVLFCKDTIEFADSIFAKGSPWQNIKALWAPARRQVENKQALAAVKESANPASLPQSFFKQQFENAARLLLERHLELGVPQEELKGEFLKMIPALGLSEDAYQGYRSYDEIMTAIIQSRFTDTAGQQHFIFANEERQRYGQLLHDQQYSDVKPSAVGVAINAFAQAALTAGQAIWNLPATIMSALSASAGSAAACSRPLTDSPDRGQPIKNFMLKNGLSLLLVALVITGTVFMAMTTNIDLTHHIGWVTEQMANAAVSVMAIGSIGFVMVSAWKMGQAITSGIRQSWYNFWHNCKEAGLGRAIKEMLVAVKHEGYPIYRNSTSDQLYQHVNGAYLPLARDGSQEGDTAKPAGSMELQQRPPLLSLLAGLSYVLTLSAMVLGILTIAGVAVSMPPGLPIYLALGCLAFRRLLSGMERAHQDREMLKFSDEGATQGETSEDTSAMPQADIHFDYNDPLLLSPEMTAESFDELKKSMEPGDQYWVNLTSDDGSDFTAELELVDTDNGRQLILNSTLKLEHESGRVVMLIEGDISPSAGIETLFANVSKAFGVLIGESCSPSQVQQYVNVVGDREITCKNPTIGEWVRMARQGHDLVTQLIESLPKAVAATDLSIFDNGWLLTGEFFKHGFIERTREIANSRSDHRLLLAFELGVDNVYIKSTIKTLHECGLTADKSASRRCDVLHQNEEQQSVIQAAIEEERNPMAGQLTAQGSRTSDQSEERQGGSKLFASSRRGLFGSSNREQRSSGIVLMEQADDTQQPAVSLA